MYKYENGTARANSGIRNRVVCYVCLGQVGVFGLLTAAGAAAAAKPKGPFALAKKAAAAKMRMRELLAARAAGELQGEDLPPMPPVGTKFWIIPNAAAEVGEVEAPLASAAPPPKRGRRATATKKQPAEDAAAAAAAKPTPINKNGSSQGGGGCGCGRRSTTSSQAHQKGLSGVQYRHTGASTDLPRSRTSLNTAPASAIR